MALQTYQLFIKISRSARVRVGRMGPRQFAPGLYVYTGSARRNLVDRVARHFSQNKRFYWHIDYLLAHPAVTIADARFSDRGECDMNRSTKGLIPIPGFGASDCVRGCGSHLKFLGPG